MEEEEDGNEMKGFVCRSLAAASEKLVIGVDVFASGKSFGFFGLRG